MKQNINGFLQKREVCFTRFSMVLPTTLDKEYNEEKQFNKFYRSNVRIPF